jgi:prevent-host-death family protein
MKTFSIADARNRLPELIHEAEAGQPVRLTRRGQPVAVLLADREYARLREAAAGVDFAAWAQAWRGQQASGFEGVTAEELVRWRAL